MRFRFASIRARLIGAGGLVLLSFIAITGAALQTAHTDSVRAAYYARLQGTVYLLLAGAEVDVSGALQMPREFAEPRLSLPGSGLYASILHVENKQTWQSASTVGKGLPFQRDASAGQWRYDTILSGAEAFLGVSYGVSWAGPGGSVPLVLSVLESKASLDSETSAFRRTLWGWLASAGVLLLLSQTLLLQWGLSPLRRVSQEIARIERGEQTEVQGTYAAEIGALTTNLNTLIRQERVRQTRYKEALSYLAHSLKTPLAVLRNALAQPQELSGTVAQQVNRMDHIVQYQLGRAAASGAARFTPYLALAPVAQRILDSLSKVHAEKKLQMQLVCPDTLRWRIDEGDAFELLGNLMDNAAKWAVGRVAVRIWQEDQALRMRVDDDGPGFSDTEAVLQLHVRGDEQVPGHGVGLAVVNDLVASYDGQLVLGRADWGGGRADVTVPAG
jgi:two-component system, OmpR family, sensor histidine kinase PhoQ